MKYKFFYYDVETSGLDASKTAIYELSYMLLNEHKEEETGGIIKMTPYGFELEEKAMEMAKKRYSIDEMFNFQSQKSGYESLLTILDANVDKFDPMDKLIPVGYNIAFDNSHLWEFFKRNNNNFLGSYFHFPGIDISCDVISYFVRNNMQIPKSKKLSDIAKTLGIQVEEDKLHSSHYDLFLTIEIHKITKNPHQDRY